MLNKKTAFKPKAAVRRPPPASAPQASQRPSPAEPSKTPAPKEPTPSSQPAAEPTPSAPPVSPNAPAADIVAPAQARGKDVGKTVSEEAPRSSVSSTAATVVAAGREERSATPAQLKAFKAPVPTLPGTTVAGSANVAAADISSKAPTAPAATRQPSSTTPTRAPIPPTTQPISAARVQVAGPQDESVEEAVSPDGSATPVQPVPEPVEPSNQQTETAKPARGRKRAAAAATAGDSGEPSTRAPAAKRPRKRAAALPGEEGYQAAAPRATRSRKRDASTTEDGAVEEEDEDGSTRLKRKLPPRAQREATPPDAEAVEIDITQVKMADLAKDMHIGKKFSLHDELMERERAKRLRAQDRRKRQQNGEDADDDNSSTPIKEGETPAASSSTDANTNTQPTPAAGTGTEPTTDPEPSASNRAPIGETYQIIDGEIVLDHRSLQVDRHARAREEAGELVEIEENDFTHHTTTATYLRRNLKPQQWTDDETELFYQALSAFGTDFDTICRMFKSKSRKHIKLKFNREERVNPARINAALVGQKTVSIDMDAYKKATGQEYETAEAIYAEQRKAEEEFEARQKALEDEKTEEVRRKKEEVLAQLNSSVGEEGLKKGAREGRKKKQNFVGL
ncbi:hypothetical protein N0V88_001760 [Collariella sp. IMI 366227]|nr:hypothetical protein N0V88_001760 [Collariella sp. IMI 366227]